MPATHRHLRLLGYPSSNTTINNGGAGAIQLGIKYDLIREMVLHSTVLPKVQRARYRLLLESLDCVGRKSLIMSTVLPHESRYCMSPRYRDL